MYSLYQSQIRETLQAKIYQKSHNFTQIFGQRTFYLIKEKKIWPFTFKEFQAIGIKMPENFWKVTEELNNLKGKFWSQRGNIFFQLGFINEISHFDNKHLKDKDFPEKIKEMREDTLNKITKETNLKLAFKENMPQTTIIINLKKTDEELLNEMQNGSAEKIKKAIKKGIKIREWTAKDQETFFQKRKIIAGEKGFSTITRKQYNNLLDALQKNHQGTFFVAELNSEIIAGSICIFHEKTIVYLYGFSDRKYANIGGHHYLKYWLFQRAKEHWFEYCDLMGGAPTGVPSHPLAWVSRFKESLGGEKVEFYGNYDLILNPILYYLFKLFYLLKKSDIFQKIHSRRKK